MPVVVVYPLLRGSELRSALDIHHIARSTAAVHDEADAVIVAERALPLYSSKM